MKVKEIIAEYLSTKRGQLIAYHSLEGAKKYGELIHDIIHNQGTYDRAFRELKNSPKELEAYGLRLELQPRNNSACDWWKICKL